MKTRYDRKAPPKMPMARLPVYSDTPLNMPNGEVDVQSGHLDQDSSENNFSLNTEHPVSNILVDQPGVNDGTGPILRETETSEKISLALIDDSPYQPRIQYDPAEIDNLAHSLAAAGLEDPITLRPTKNGRYELIGGHRRVRAARSLGWTEITADVKDRSDREAQLATMVQNEGRVDLTDYERGKLYLSAQRSEFASTQTEIAHLFGTTQARVSRCMAMLKLPTIFTEMLESKPDLFGYNCAEAIVQLIKEYPSEMALIEAGVKRIIEEDADQKSVKQWVQQMIKQKHNQEKPAQPAIITDRAGRPMFTTKLSGREFTVRIKAADIDTKELEEIVLTALRLRAERTEA